MESVAAKRSLVRIVAGLSPLILLAIGLVGCGGEPGLVSVQGRVTYKGKPVSTGDVYFSPTQAGARGAQGTLDSDGSYRLGTLGPNDGAYVGTYKVSIVSRGPDKPIPAKQVGRLMPEDMQGTGDPLVPRRYFSPETSKLDAEVAAGKTNTFDFDLTD